MMKMIFYLMTMILGINIIIITVLNLVSKKVFFDREKPSPFECGFDPKNSSRLPFSMQFFMIAVIFVIFDVELSLLLPLILILKSSNFMEVSMIMNLFIMILLIGLLHEQNQGSLNWAK
uniref:NADH-ubiquinone oxidoreductase chain 3 n=1 Tax=Melanobaris laticollis TaxID=1069881 RepID=J9PIX0_9CUCU|nr:NADH dehydrogenase subunit 3 [Melanobaris laticollis]